MRQVFFRSRGLHMQGQSMHAIFQSSTCMKAMCDSSGFNGVSLVCCLHQISELPECEKATGAALAGRDGLG